MTNHEHPSPEDRHPVGPERERLQPSEIDFTGAVEQHDDMLDLIGDAIVEARSSGGEIPDWGARAIARLLADGLEPGSALHHFAATGRTDLDAINAETMPIYSDSATPADVKQWIDYLGAFLIHRHETPADDSDGEQERHIDAGIAEAARLSREINLDTAMAIAGALAARYGDESALARFADTGVGGYLALREEYLDIYADPATPAEVKRWIDWFGTFLVQRESTGTGRRFMNEHLDPQLERVLVKATVPVWDQDYPVRVPATLTARDIIRLGARLEALEEIHEPAFRAFLRLADVNAADPGLVDTFHETYVGRYRTMDTLIDELTEITEWQTAVDELSTRLGIDGMVTIDRSAVERLVRERWDITEEDGVLYVFEK